MRATPPALRYRAAHPLSPPLPDRVITEFATADDVRSGMIRAVAMLRRDGGADRIEWWGPALDGGALQLQAADGQDGGRRAAFPVGPAGIVVVAGDRCGPQLGPAVKLLGPILRRRWTEERLARAAARLARRNEALDDFATLVAHELKALLHAALLQDDGSAGVERALDLVDSLLDAARSEPADPSASAGECLAEALRDLGPFAAEVSTDLPPRFPLPPAALRVVLRNLVANAVDAGARHVHVAAVATPDAWRLVVDDDGAGVAAPGRYAVGSRLGLSLCRRVAGRFGGALNLEPGPGGGTRATLALDRSRP